MALHLLTPDELSRFENKCAELEAEVQKMRMAVLNFKDKTGNDETVGEAFQAIKVKVDDLATITGIAVQTD